MSATSLKHEPEHGSFHEMNGLRLITIHYFTDLNTAATATKGKAYRRKRNKGGGGISMRKLKEILRAVALWRFKSVTVVWEMPNRARVAHNKDGPKWHQGARRGQAELAIPRTQLPLSCNSQRRSECFGSPGRDEKRFKEFRKRWETRCCGHFERKWRSS